MSPLTTYPICSTIESVWEAVLSAVLDSDDQDSRLGPMKELLARGFTLTNPEASWLSCPRRRIKPAYAAAEIAWFFQQTESVRLLLPYAPSYGKYCNDGRARGAYGARWMTKDSTSQLDRVVQLLREEPNTRRAVVCLYNEVDLTRSVDGVINDIPCALTWQFIQRDGFLHMIANVRSQDIWLGMPYDVLTNTTIQRAIAGTLGLQVGNYTHIAGSLHLYGKHEESAREALALPREYKTGKESPCYWGGNVSLEDLYCLPDILRQLHTWDLIGTDMRTRIVRNIQDLPVVARDLSCCLLRQWDQIPAIGPDSSALQTSLDYFYSGDANVDH